MQPWLFSKLRRNVIQYLHLIACIIQKAPREEFIVNLVIFMDVQLWTIESINFVKKETTTLNFEAANEDLLFFCLR